MYQLLTPSQISKALKNSRCFIIHTKMDFMVNPLSGALILVSLECPYSPQYIERWGARSFNLITGDRLSVSKRIELCECLLCADWPAQAASFSTPRGGDIRLPVCRLRSGDGKRPRRSHHWQQEYSIFELKRSCSCGSASNVVHRTINSICENSKPPLLLW